MSWQILIGIFIEFIYNNKSMGFSINKKIIPMLTCPVVELSTIQSIYPWPYKYTVKNQYTISELSSRV